MRDRVDTSPVPLAWAAYNQISPGRTRLAASGLHQDQAVLRRFWDGERDALAAVFDHYAPRLTRYLVRGFSFKSNGSPMAFGGLRHRQDLHDVVAETFRRAFEKRARLAYSGAARYESYLFAIARNLVIDRLRKQRNRWVNLDHDPPSEATGRPSFPCPEKKLHQAELSRLMRSFLDNLSPVEQRFVHLRYQEQLSQASVAERMDKTRRWVRSLEVKLRRRLVRQMRGTGYLSSADRR